MNYAAKASPSGRDILSLSGDAGFHHNIFYQGESVFRVTQFDIFLFPWHVAELIGREFGSGETPSAGSKPSPLVGMKSSFHRPGGRVTPLDY